ncbi:MAG TPA: hypothetical protein VJ464_18900 [Blastocatellia bacterium]|nr:hypothetical protein [Blastocatellia bacterium]
MDRHLRRRLKPVSRRALCQLPCAERAIQQRRLSDPRRPSGALLDQLEQRHLPRRQARLG